MYNAIVVKLTNVRPHFNADRLQLATVCGNQVVVGLDAKDGELGIYFDVDGQLSKEFCHYNNLYRDKEKNSNTTTGGMFDDNRKIRAQKFRGEKSEGFWLPIDSLYEFIKHDISKFEKLLVEGYEFTEIDGKSICNKYINPNTRTQGNTNNKDRSKESIMFKKHIETEQFGRNSDKIDRNSLIIITEKLHGTSQRVGYVSRVKPLSKLKMLVNRLKMIFYPEVVWEYLVGTRNVVLNNNSRDYHGLDFRQEAAKPFINNLKKGETVYYEVVGYESGGKTIMPTCSNTKLKPFLDKEDYNFIIKNFGDETKFTYKVDNSFDIYVYRITLTNEDGYSVDYSWEQVKERCRELGVKHVPELRKSLTKLDLAKLQCVIDPTCDGRYNLTDDRDINELFLKYVQSLANDHSTSLLDYGHIREGVCIRIEDNFTPTIYKEKSFYFKVLEGIVKDSGIVDTEESN